MLKRIRNLREDHDFKQSDIANQLGLSQPQYQRYESGTYQIPIDILIKLSKIYDVSVDYLLGLTDIKKSPTPSISAKAKKALTYFNRLNEENQDYVLGEMVKLHREQNEQSTKKKGIG